MKAGIALLLLFGAVALSIQRSSDWSRWSAAYDRCKAMGGEHYRHKNCYRTKIEYINIDGDDQ